MELIISPKVSVLIITYNHEKFIAQAIESALMQKTDFDYEIVIGEDYSADSTRNIVLDYSRKHPEKITALLHERNLGLGGKMNLAAGLEKCRGRYIAFMEGDDYWISPHKLQKQVDFLDDHSECSTCYHPVRYVNENGEFLEEAVDFSYVPKSATLADLLRINFISTSSIMFRANLFGRFPDWYFSLRHGDWALHILNAMRGNIGRIDEILGAYRVHTEGMTAQWVGLASTEHLQETIRVYETVDTHLNTGQSKLIKDMLSKNYFFLCGAYVLEKKWLAALQAMIRSLTLSPFNRHIPRKKLFLSLCRKAIGKKPLTPAEEGGERLQNGSDLALPDCAATPLACSGATDPSVPKETSFRKTVRRILRRASSWFVTRSLLLWLSRHSWLPEAVWGKLPVEQRFRVDMGDGNSFLYHSELSDSIGRGLFWKGLPAFEPDTVKIFSELVKEADIVVDVGANTGLYTLVACAVSKSADVIAIEPAPAIAHLLDQNIAINNWQDRCRVIMAAASDCSGPGKLHVPHTPYGNCSTMCSLNPSGFGGLPGYLLDIPIVTLDEVCPANKTIHLIKIDVEGLAYQVLQGAKRILADSQPFLILEILPVDSASEIAGQLKSLGYSFFDIRPDNLLQLDNLIYGGQRLNTNVLCAIPQKLPRKLSALISETETIGGNSAKTPMTNRPSIK